MRSTAIFPVLAILLTAMNIFIAMKIKGKSEQSNSNGIFYQAPRDYLRRLEGLRRLAVNSVTLVESGTNEFDLTVEGQSAVDDGDVSEHL